MKKIISIIGIFILFTILAYGNELKRAKVYLPSSWIGMKNIAPYIYVEANMSLKQQKIVLTEFKNSQQYLVDIYGDIKTNPNLYFCESKSCAESIGMYGTVVGNRLVNSLILTKKGTTKEIIAHELAHEELSYRVGGLYRWWKEIPIWFDEGLAVYISNEHRHDKRAWKQIINQKLPYPKINEMISLNNWNLATKKYNENVDYDQLVVSYATAGHIVEKWYKKANKDGLIELLNDVKNGMSFEQAYKKHNKT
jgi:hypothetical protein